MTERQRNALIMVAAVAVAFGAGTTWQYLQARAARAERDTAVQELQAAQQALALQELEGTLAMATVAAQFGNFERSRQLVSEFFTKLQEIAPDAPEASRTGLNGILAQRDAMITLLSRSQPESGIDLARMLTLFQRALGKEATVPAPLQPEEPGTPPG